MRQISFDDGCGFVMREQQGAQTVTMVTDLSGWLEGSNVETERVRRLGDGDFPSASWRTGRTLTLSVLEELGSRAATVARARAVSAVFRSGEVGHGTITVDDPDVGVVSAVGVALDGRPKVLHDERQFRVEWELPLIAPDPYLYGPAQVTQVFTGGVGQGLVYPLFDDEQGNTTGVLEYGDAPPPPAPLTNTGNAAAYPLVRVEGSFPSGFVLTFTARGRSFGVTYRAEVQQRVPVVVDMAGSVTVQGTDQSWALTDRRWGGVGPGEQMTVALRGVAAEASGLGTVELRSTYL